MLQPRRVSAFCLVLAALALAALGFAQDGVSDAGIARTKYLGNLGILPSSKEVVVEDFVNYHRHELARPKAGQAVALDVRWGSESAANGDEAILQVGLSTSLAHDREQLRPLNLSLVIDKSGSMADADKLVRVKAALIKLVSQLRPVDTLSIVVFDSSAEVLLPAQKVSDAESIKNLIRQLEPGSSTNLNAGLMLGYREAAKHLSRETTNRVILLTDGIANQGVTDPAKIAAASLGYNDRGIDLSTIGVGLDLNKDLLSQLAKSGRGLFHFVSDTDDIEKVFVKELQSLISPVASEPDLTINFGEGLEVEKVFGYDPKISKNSVQIKLDNMNSGMTEVVLMRVRINANERKPLPVTARLSYFDIDKHKAEEVSQTGSLTLVERAKGDKLQDESVAKNYTIALLAQAIRDMAIDCESDRYAEAERCLTTAVARTLERYPSQDDPDIKRTLATAQKYQDVLRKRDHGDGVDERPRTIEGDNLIFNGDFSQGNLGFTSPALSYFDPAPNCLWPAGYTVAATFNNPQLHRLIAQEEYAAPKRPNGNEQVFFANVGGPDTLEIWKAEVKCRPHTTYMLSFQSISLTPGPEWIPTFEIRVNRDRSEPQPAGAGHYAEIKSKWESGGSTTATVSIYRMAIPHGGGLIAISNIEMIPVR